MRKTKYKGSPAPAITMGDYVKMMDLLKSQNPDLFAVGCQIARGNGYSFEFCWSVFRSVNKINRDKFDEAGDFHFDFGLLIVQGRTCNFLVNIMIRDGEKIKDIQAFRECQCYRNKCKLPKRCLKSLKNILDSKEVKDNIYRIYYE